MILSIINMKGGTGKTTTAIALATAAQRNGKDVTVYDADPQSSASLWAMSAEEAGDALPFPVSSANIADVRRLGKAMNGSSESWAIIDCPPSGSIMDEAAKAADMVVIPTTTGVADVTKALETAATLKDAGIWYTILVTMTAAGTLTLRDTLSDLEERDESYFKTTIPRREALKSFFGNSFGDELFGYAEVYGEIEEAFDGD